MKRILSLVLCFLIWDCKGQFFTKKTFGKGAPKIQFKAINFPKPDLSPLDIHFNDPSLRYYPDPNVQSAAVKPIYRLKRDTQRQSKAIQERQFNIDQQLDLIFNDNFNPSPQDDNTNNGLNINSATDVFDVFEVHSLIERPPSDPDFALPITRENPYLNPKFNAATFSRPQN